VTPDLTKLLLRNEIELGKSVLELGKKVNGTSTATLLQSPLAKESFKDIEIKTERIDDTFDGTETVVQTDLPNPLEKSPRSDTAKTAATATAPSPTSYTKEKQKKSESPETTLSKRPTLSLVPKSVDDNMSMDENISDLPVDPVDMNVQEIEKTERKRQRNRVAATKCRKRKIEKITQLEEEVTELKTKLEEKKKEKRKYEEEIEEIRIKIKIHIKQGCTGLEEYLTD
jgi:uncharacterized protein YoxC